MNYLDNTIFLSTIGIIATILSLSYRVPQIYKIWQTKDVSALSRVSYIKQDLSYICWILYSIGKEDIILLISSILAISQNIIIHILMYKYMN